MAACKARRKHDEHIATLRQLTQAAIDCRNSMKKLNPGVYYRDSESCDGFRKRSHATIRLCGVARRHMTKPAKDGTSWMGDLLVAKGSLRRFFTEIGMHPTNPIFQQLEQLPKPRAQYPS